MSNEIIKFDKKLKKVRLKKNLSQGDNDVTNIGRFGGGKTLAQSSGAVKLGDSSFHGSLAHRQKLDGCFITVTPFTQGTICSNIIGYHRVPVFTAGLVPDLPDPLQGGVKALPPMIPDYVR